MDGQHHPDAAAVAYKIAAYVETHPDFGNWTPRRAAYEAVMVVLSDEGAAYDVMLAMGDRQPYGYMERVGWGWSDDCCNRPVLDGDWPDNPDEAPIYIMREAQP